MPRIYGDLLAQERAKLVDAIDRDNLAINDNLYKRWLPAYLWQWSSGMADYEQIGDAGYAAKMGKPSGLIASLRVEELWVKGDVYVTLYYSGDSNTGDYSTDVSVLAVPDDGSVDGTPTTVAKTLSPPSAANKLSSDTVSPYPVDADDEVMFIKLERKTSGDGNSGNLLFVGAMVRFWPDRRV